MYSEYLKSQHPSIYIQSEESELHFPLISTTQHSSSQVNFKKMKKAQHLLPPFCTSCSTTRSNSVSALITTWNILVRSTVMSIPFNSVHTFLACLFLDNLVSVNTFLLWLHDPIVLIISAYYSSVLPPSIQP